MNGIKKVFEMFNDKNGKGGIKKVAQHFGITPWAVSKWSFEGVPIDRCLELEELTKGAVTCEELNPAAKWYVITNRKKTRNKKATNAN